MSKALTLTYIPPSKDMLCKNTHYSHVHEVISTILMPFHMLNRSPLNALKVSYFDSELLDGLERAKKYILSNPQKGNLSSCSEMAKQLVPLDETLSILEKMTNAYQIATHGFETKELKSIKNQLYVWYLLELYIQVFEGIKLRDMVLIQEKIRQLTNELATHPLEQRVQEIKSQLNDDQKKLQFYLIELKFLPDERRAKGYVILDPKNTERLEKIKDEIIKFLTDNRVFFYPIEVFNSKTDQEGSRLRVHVLSSLVAFKGSRFIHNYLNMSNYFRFNFGHLYQSVGNEYSNISFMAHPPTLDSGITIGATDTTAFYKVLRDYLTDKPEDQNNITIVSAFNPYQTGHFLTKIQKLLIKVANFVIPNQIVMGLGRFNLAFFSNYPGENPFWQQRFIVAQGLDNPVLSITCKNDRTHLKPSYSLGTSYATPVVAQMAKLLEALFLPYKRKSRIIYAGEEYSYGLTPYEINQAILEGATPLSGIWLETSAIYGRGHINMHYAAFKAMLLAMQLLEGFDMPDLILEEDVGLFQLN